LNLSIKFIAVVFIAERGCGHNGRSVEEVSTRPTQHRSIIYNSMTTPHPYLPHRLFFTFLIISYDRLLLILIALHVARPEAGRSLTSQPAQDLISCTGRPGSLRTIINLGLCLPTEWL
jgi:hypothetical protein